MNRHVKLMGTFITRSPLSHIGETISTGSYLVQEPILQPDGSIEEVFCYSGNAWRGQLRDLSATYMLTQLKTTVPLEAFHLLYSGGRIGGEQKVDIGAARAMRSAIPHVSLFGGGVGNQILPGKLRVSNAYPICAEAMPALPESVHERAVSVRVCGDVLLGHQVHAVLERGDQHDVGRGVVRAQLVLGDAAVDVVHDRPAHLTETAVDATDRLLHFPPGGAVVLDPLARRGGQLDERDVLQLAFVQERLECEQPLQDALRVVHAVHAQQ